MEIRGIPNQQSHDITMSRPSNTNHRGSDKGRKIPGDAAVVARLAEKLSRLPEIREELVEVVAQRLASGEYLTKEAAQKTAGEILDGESY